MVFITRLKKILKLRFHIFVVLYSLFWLNLRLFFYKKKGIKIIVYTLSNDYFFEVFKPIYLNLLKNPKLRIFFTYPDRNDVYPFDKKSVKNYLLKNKVKKRFLIPWTAVPYFIPDLFISSEINYENKILDLDKVKKLQIYHGAGVYTFYKAKDLISKYNIHFSINSEVTKFLKENYIEKNKKIKIYNIGYPKTDFLFQSYDKEKNDKIIVYAPHWDKFSSIHKFGEEFIRELAEINAKILVKPHNHLFISYSCENWKQRLKKLTQKYENIKLVLDADTSLLYPTADIVITDTGTTAGIEASIAKKSLIVFYNKKWFKNNQSTKVEKDICETAICFDSLEKGIGIIKKIINKDKKTQKKIEQQRIKQEKLVKKYLYNPGSATKFAVSAILKELEID